MLNLYNLWKKSIGLRSRSYYSVLLIYGLVYSLVVGREYCTNSAWFLLVKPLSVTERRASERLTLTKTKPVIDENRVDNNNENQEQKADIIT